MNYRVYIVGRVAHWNTCFDPVGFNPIAISSVWDETWDCSYESTAHVCVCCAVSALLWHLAAIDSEMWFTRYHNPCHRPKPSWQSIHNHMHVRPSIILIHIFTTHVECRQLHFYWPRNIVSLIISTWTEKKNRLEFIWTSIFVRKNSLKFACICTVHNLLISYPIT